MATAPGVAAERRRRYARSRSGMCRLLRRPGVCPVGLVQKDRGRPRGPGERDQGRGAGIRELRKCSCAPAPPPNPTRPEQFEQSSRRPVDRHDSESQTGPARRRQNDLVGALLPEPPEPHARVRCLLRQRPLPDGRNNRGSPATLSGPRTARTATAALPGGVRTVTWVSVMTGIRPPGGCPRGSGPGGSRCGTGGATASARRVAASCPRRSSTTAAPSCSGWPSRGHRVHPAGHRVKKAELDRRLGILARRAGRQGAGRVDQRQVRPCTRGATGP